MSSSKKKVFYLLGAEIEEIKSRLPSNGDVLRLFCHHHFSLKKIIFHAAKSVISVVLKLYKKEEIPVMQTKNACKKLVLLHSEWVKIKKSKYKKNPCYIKKNRMFSMKMNQLFDITPKNVLNLIKNESSKRFLLAQRKDYRLGLRLTYVQKEKGKFHSIFST